jgi:IS5 family transposase
MSWQNLRPLERSTLKVKEPLKNVFLYNELAWNVMEGDMSQQTSFLSLGCMTKLTRADRFLDEMNRVVPWTQLLEVIAPHWGQAHTGRKRTELELLLRLHCLQLWYNLSDPALEDAVHDRLSFQRFLQLDPLTEKVPDESTVLHFRHLLEKHQLAEAIFARVREQLEQRGLLLKSGTIVDATIIAASPSTKNESGHRDSEMSSTRKGTTWHFGMKAHIGVDAKSGLVHSVRTSTAKVKDSDLLPELLHGQEQVLVGDGAYGNMTLKAYCRKAGLRYLISDNAGRNVKLSGKQRRANRHKASARAKVEFPFRIIKQLWGHTRVRFRGLAKNTARLQVLFALSNLFQARRALLAAS